MVSPQTSYLLRQHISSGNISPQAAGNVVEASYEPKQLYNLVEFEEAAQIDYDSEQLNEIVEVEEEA